MNRLQRRSMKNKGEEEGGDTSQCKSDRGQFLAKMVAYVTLVSINLGV